MIVIPNGKPFHVEYLNKQIMKRKAMSEKNEKWECRFFENIYLFFVWLFKK
jgi:hypothetical protein